MTMQDGPGFGDIAWDDLRPDLVARLQASTEPANRYDRSDSDALFSGRALLERFGLTKAGVRPDATTPSPEALLLFGTEEAIARHFPFLQTRVSLRDLARNREKSEELPKNILECLEALGRFVATELPAQADHATIRDAAVLPWLFDMAVTRDYTQTRVARLVRDRDHVFLEYPRQIAFDEGSDRSSLVRYVHNRPIQAVLSQFYPTMQDDTREGDGTEKTAVGRERAYFGLAALRIEGRFFKIMATLSHSDLHGDPDSRPAGLPRNRQESGAAAPDSPRQQQKVGKGSNRTMQVLRTVIAMVKSWFPSEPTRLTGPARVPPEPARSPTASPFGASADAPTRSRPAPHPRPTHQPPNSLPSLVDPYRSQARLRKASRSSASASPIPPTERPDPSERTARILAFCATPRHRDEIQKHVGMNNRDHFRKEVLNRLIAQGLLAPTLPDKPNSPRQQYVTLSAAAASTESGLTRVREPF